jgi:hypothetical protein
MPGSTAGRIHALVALGALVACAVVPTLAPALAAQGEVDRAQKRAAASKGAVGADAQGAIGVKGVSQGSPAFERARRAVTAAPPPIAAERTTGLQARIGSLPFTGWDLIILGGVSMVLAGIGFMLHRLSHPRAPNA